MIPLTRVLIGLVVGVPVGWLLSEVRRGWRAGSQPADAPPFAGELSGRPRQVGEPDWWIDER